jgi:sporulation protein YlmC with PRC-barrel domain
MRLSDENLRGRTVIAADGQAIGEIVALFLDSDAWRVESLQIKLRNEVADQLGAPRHVSRWDT